MRHRHMPVQFSLHLPKVHGKGGAKQATPPPLSSRDALQKAARSPAAAGAAHSVGVLEANCPGPELLASPQVTGQASLGGLPAGAPILLFPDS